ncbi:unnamed protein product [Schistosoma bovis]|uniref:Uncharacterized protein n=3 Tax=Schistosoma TaxID=6181 RepID=A0A922S134_SCHHA|nr:hypothetical protein MS3_00005841 [Schistosoma haematobium]CAH8542638.1 unnamed protein product [Schistosoma intercalatum]CAH8558778.1 unnamed protein product [Schistosoma bovis]KAH9588443.1 hypothetical protein MS3_00005841 [Schistosoma haematobium]CAH8542896.1 unnamed protein product [Schistosoma intercalatum]CAH8565023.1 unnamed protein product [Schistosoma haematobium]
MISQLVTMNVALVLLFTFNMMKLEAYTYLASIKFDDSGEMYISLGSVNISLSSDYELTISDRDCTKTLSLKPPTEEENLFKHGYRPGSSLCKSWFLLKRPHKKRRTECLLSDLLF